MRRVKTEKECLEYLQNPNLLKLSSTDCASCEGKITKQSCWEALQSIEESPGNDDFTK